MLVRAGRRVINDNRRGRINSVFVSVFGGRRGCVILAAAALATLAGCDTSPSASPTTTHVVDTGPAQSSVQHVLRVRPVLSAVAAVAAGTPRSTDQCWNVAPTAVATVPPVGSRQRTELIARCRSLRQTNDPTAQATALAQIDCGSGVLDVLAGQDDPVLPLVTCDQAGKAKYSLGPTVLDGGQVSGAIAKPDPSSPGAFLVSITFTRAGASTWAGFTASHVGDQAAFVLDGEVLSAPKIASAITSGATEIAGDFTRAQAQQLAGTLSGG